MNITNLPIGPIVDEKGNVSTEYRIFFNQLINQLQNSLSNERYLFPQQSTENENTLSTPKNEASILYNSESNSFKLNKGPVIPGENTTPYVTMGSYEGEKTTAEIASIPSGQRNGRSFWNTTESKLVTGANDTFIEIG